MIKSFITATTMSNAGDIVGKIISAHQGKIVDRHPNFMCSTSPSGIVYMFKKNGSEKDITIHVIDKPSRCTYAVNVKEVDNTSTSIEYIGPVDILPALMCTGLLSGMNLVAVD